MKLTTPVEIKALSKRFESNVKIAAIGSCFADEIGELLRESGFDVSLNPFGVLYNPASIAAAVDRLTSGKNFIASDVIFSKPLDRYNSFCHHTSFSRPSAEEFLENANAVLDQACNAFRQADICLITLGTAWVFRNIASGQIVANCNKVADNEFIRERLSVEAVISLLSNMVCEHSQKQWIFTISPIRHFADGANGNAVSKATLLLAIDYIVGHFPNAHYFPAFEIMMDELRDYRFYSEDMTHPSSQAAEYIFSKFVEYTFSPAAIIKADAARKAYRLGQHHQIFK